MNKRVLRFGLFALLGVAIAGGLLLASKQTANGGKLQLKGFGHDLNGKRTAEFTYDPPENLNLSNGLYVLDYACVDTEGRESQNGFSPGYTRPTRLDISVPCPTAHVWQLRAKLLAPTTGIAALSLRAKAVWREKRLSGWHESPARFLPPVYSFPITNDAHR